MHVASKLPDLVIQKIIGIVTKPPSDSLFFWKNALPFLAVCSAWRHAAKPIVYSKVFIESMETGYAAQRSIRRSHLLDRAISSNIDLVASVSSTQFVKHIDIDINTLGCLRALVCRRDIVHYLRANSWPGAVSLSVKLAIYNLTYNADLVYSETLLEHQKDFCSSLAKQMPGIVDISVDIQNPLQLCISFGRLIVKTYLQKLRSLKCPAQIVDDIGKFPSQLTSLSITFISGRAASVPKLDIGMLKQLEIVCAPNDFDLISLVDAEKDKSIEFSNLVSLKLECPICFGHDPLDFGPEEPFVDDGTYHPKLLFPRLEDLVLNVSSPRVIQRLLISGQYCWENVSSLVLLSDPTLEFLGNVTTFGRLLRIMPRISKLTFDSPYSFPDATAKNWLIGCLADKLSHINIGLGTTLDFPQFSKDLVSLSLAVMGESWLHFPYLNTRALQHLQLSNVPYNRFWQIFQNSSINDVLFLENLVSLKVGFNAQEVYSIKGLEEFFRSSCNSKSLIVHCPRLQEIGINGAHFCGLWSLFSNEQNVWSNVSRLCIISGEHSIFWEDDDTEFSTDERTRIMQFTGAVSRRIIGQLPNISDLETDAFSSVTRSYSRQLRRLISKHHYSLDALCFSDRLVTLNIDFDVIPSIGMIDMSGNGLETLTLSHPSGFSWGWIKLRGSLDEIRFDRLFELCIEVKDIKQNIPEDTSLPLSSSSVADDVDNSRLSVYMPRLHTLIVNAGPGDVSYWNADIYMTNLLQIRLTGAFSGIAAICRHIFFNRVGSYALNVESISIEDESLFYNATNHVFGDSNIYSDATLDLPLMPFDINADNVNWTYLTSLDCKRVQFNTMVSLLPKLINLRSLDYEFVPAYMPDMTDNVILSKSISTMFIVISSVQYGGYEYSSEEPSTPVSSERHSNESFTSAEDRMAFACTAYMITRIPSLRSVGIYSGFSWTLSDIVEKYADKYPHLSRLQID